MFNYNSICWTYDTHKHTHILHIISPYCHIHTANVHANLQHFVPTHTQNKSPIQINRWGRLLNGNLSLARNITVQTDRETGGQMTACVCFPVFDKPYSCRCQVGTNDFKTQKWTVSKQKWLMVFWRMDWMCVCLELGLVEKIIAIIKKWKTNKTLLIIITSLLTASGLQWPYDAHWYVEWNSLTCILFGNVNRGWSSFDY